MKFLIIFIVAVFVNNVVLSQFLGICPFLGVSKKVSTATGMGAAVTFVLLLATMVTWLVQTYILVPLGLEFLQTIAFILVIATLVQMIEMIIKKISPALYQALGVFLPLITTNCAVLGVTVNNIDNSYGFLESLANSFGAGMGFLLAMVLFAGIRGKMETSDIPEALKGVPSVLIAASILSVSFMGFSGVVEGIFG